MKDQVFFLLFFFFLGKNEKSSLLVTSEGKEKQTTLSMYNTREKIQVREPNIYDILHKPTFEHGILFP